MNDEELHKYEKWQEKNRQRERKKSTEVFGIALESADAEQPVWVQLTTPNNTATKDVLERKL